MRTMTAGLIRLATLAEHENSPFRSLVAALAKAAGSQEDLFARASYLEGLTGFSPGAIVGKERAFFPQALQALRSGEPNRLVDALRYEHGMSDKDIALMVGNRDTGLFASLVNGVSSVMSGQTFRGLGAEDVAFPLAAGLSPLTGKPLKYGKGRGMFYWLGTKASPKISLRGIKSLAFKESKNRALDIIRGTRSEEQYQDTLDAPAGDGEGLSLQEMISQPESAGRANFVDLAAAIYQDPWVMKVIDREVKSLLTTERQEAVWQAIRQDPSMLKITPKGIGTSNKDLAKAVSRITGDPFTRSLEVSTGKTFRTKVQPAMVEALADSQIAKKLLQKRHILETVQEMSRRPQSGRENIGPIPISGIEPSRSGPVQDLDISQYQDLRSPLPPKQKVEMHPEVARRLRQQGIRLANFRARRETRRKMAAHVAALHWCYSDQPKLNARQARLYRKIKDWAMANWNAFSTRQGSLDVDGLTHSMARKAGDASFGDDPSHWVYHIARDVQRVASLSR